MTRIIIAIVAGLAAIAEIALAPVLAPWAATTAVAPLALIAAWGVVRGASEVMPASAAVAIPLGVVSEERVGWFVIAALPLLVALLFVARSEERARSSWMAACVAGAGSVGFSLILLTVAGRLRALPDEVPAILAAGGVTALLAGIGVLLLWRWRVRTQGLFA